MHPARLARLVEPYVPPKLWGKAYHVSALLQLLQHGGIGELRRNGRLRNRFQGKRGFVVGNGPSLMQMDLTRMRGEPTFTVNSFFRYAEERGVRAVAHCFTDPFYFAEPLTDLRDFAASRDPQTLCFVPLEYEHVVRPIIPDAHYLLMAGRIENNRNNDIARVIPGLQTVTLAALLVCLHMGCSPVYLIGCDTDSLSHVVGVSPLRIRENHFYDQNEPVIVDVPHFDYAGYSQAIWRMLLGYRLINERLAPGQKVYNAGVGGLLDVFERVEFESLFG